MKPKNIHSIMKFLLSLFTLLIVSCRIFAADHPNILWITSEDNASHWLGCYGNSEASTPRLDALAKEGVRFTSAYANGPVCAVARSSILTGAYAVTQGTQHMRSRHPISSVYKPYVSYLREQGYYCTNNSKTDYNFKGNDAAIWDDCSGQAHYKKRPSEKPFFAIFNLTVSHESSLFPDHISENRKRAVVPKIPRMDPSKVTVPPYLPDFPEIRSDIAIYHDTITALDTQVGRLLDELESSGLADNTIVFYYSDHGGIMPRGKRYLEDTGTRVPLLIRVPEKWRNLCPFPAGKPVSEVVSFVDLAPTLLSIVGLEKPTQMQGRAFLGSKRCEPQSDAMAFLYADRFDELQGMRRGLTDGSWKYIRRFSPHLPAAPYSSYQFGQAGWKAWKKAWENGTIEDRHKKIWETPQPIEELYDTLSDPWEINNLAADAAYRSRLETMRSRLRETMIATRDSSLVPEAMFSELSPDKPISAYLSARAADLPKLVDLAFTASSRDPHQIAHLQTGLVSTDPITRYWAAQGCLILGKDAAPVTDTLKKLLTDPNSAVRVAAAQALAVIDHRDLALTALVAELNDTASDYACLNAINALTHLNALSAIPKTWAKRILADKKSSEYLQRIAERLDN